MFLKGKSFFYIVLEIGFWLQREVELISCFCVFLEGFEYLFLSRQVVFFRVGIWVINDFGKYFFLDVIVQFVLGRVESGVGKGVLGIIQSFLCVQGVVYFRRFKLGKCQGFVQKCSFGIFWFQKKFMFEDVVQVSGSRKDQFFFLYLV